MSVEYTERNCTSMKKHTILSVLTGLVIISTVFYTVNDNTSTASGNTFTMPEDSDTDSDYHSYNIENEQKDKINKYSIDTPDKPKNSNNNYTPDKPKNNYTSNNSESNTSNHTPTPTAPKDTSNKTSKTNNKPKEKSIKVTKLEFSKHFIKLPVGKTASVAIKAKPSNSSQVKLVYKSLNKSVATFNNSKITGMKKGFTTIVITSANGSVKAACPIKVI